MSNVDPRIIEIAQRTVDAASPVIIDAADGKSEMDNVVEFSRPAPHPMPAELEKHAENLLSAARNNDIPLAVIGIDRIGRTWIGLNPVGNPEKLIGALQGCQVRIRWDEGRK